MYERKNLDYQSPCTKLEFNNSSLLPSNKETTNPKCMIETFQIYNLTSKKPIQTSSSFFFNQSYQIFLHVTVKSTTITQNTQNNKIISQNLYNHRRLQQPPS